MNKQFIQSKIYVHLSENQTKCCAPMMKKFTIFFALLFLAVSVKAQLVLEKVTAYPPYPNLLSLNGPSLSYDWNGWNEPYITTWDGTGRNSAGHIWIASYHYGRPYIEMKIFSGGSSIGASVKDGTDMNRLHFGVCKNNYLQYNNIVAQDINSLGNYYTYSDMTAKTNIAPVSSALNTILALKPVTYQWRDNSTIRTARAAANPKEIGFLAQDLEQVIPDIVAIDQDNKRLVNYQAIIPILTAAIQELTARIEVLENQLKAK